MKTTYEQAVDGYGPKSQAIKTNEELAELAIELVKWVRDDTRADRIKILEEIIDVEIMLKQLKIIFKYTPQEQQEMKVKKVAKLQMQIDNRFV